MTRTPQAQAAAHAPVSTSPAGPVHSPRRALLLALCCLALTCVPSFGQNVEHTKGAADLSLRGSFKVDPSTLGLGIQIPLGLYPGRAGLNLPVTLYYSSKVWRVHYAGYSRGSERGGQFPLPGLDNLANYTLTQARYGEDSAAGWTSSLSLPKLVYENDLQSREEYNLEGRPCGDGEAGTTYTASYPCHPNNRRTVYRLRLRMPDGSTHEMRKSAAVYPSTSGGPDQGIYEAVDDSRLRYDGATGTAYLPDGSRYFPETVAGQQVVSYADRNGNKVTFMGDGTVRDTLGRSIALPRLDENNSTRAAGDFDYYLPGIGVDLHYVFRWRNLTAVRTDGDPTVYYAGDRVCGGGFEQALTPSLFESTGDDLVCGHEFNPVVLSEIELPNHHVYRFTYNRYGEIDRVVYPTGGHEEYAYGQVLTLSGAGSPYGQANRGVTERRVSPSAAGPVQEPHWHYSTTGTVSAETSPDGTLTERYLHVGKAAADVRFGYDDVRAGMPYEVRVYSRPDSAGNRQLLRRTLTKWEYDQELAATLPDGTQVYAQRRPRVTRQVEILLDTGGDALAAATEYEHDPDLNVVATRRYDYAALGAAAALTVAVESAPLGALLRTEETDYLTADESYRARNLTSLPTASRVRDAAGNVVAQSQTFYDGAALAPYGAVTNWAEPGTPARGNATRARRWLDTTNTWVETRAEYDQCGNPVKAVDALGHESSVSYSAVYAYAYPTLTTSAVPDPSGQYGSSSALTTSTVYDFRTGLVTSTTDANGQRTAFDYADPLNRLTKVMRPDGGRTTYSYVGSGSCGAYVETRTLLDAAGRETDSYQFFDGLGRPSLSEAYDGQDANNPWLRADTVYDASGRVSQVSNAYRSPGCGAAPNPSGRWTTTEYDALGRVKTVTTADGSAVVTSYVGNTVMVTDQAGRKRRSVTDALERLARVDEPDAQTGLLDDAQGNAVQPTYYGYDALGNLRGVTQGAQTRAFAYDSLSRLTSAANPESGTVSYTYDAGGNLKTRTDARGTVATYTYDALNRNTAVTYAAAGGAAATPSVTRYYDNPAAGANGVGRLWKSEAAQAALTAVVSYDAAGRPTARAQQFWSGGGWSQPFTTGLSYNLAGAVTTETYPSGHAVSYNYDTAGRLGDFDGRPAFAANLGDGAPRTYSSEVLYDRTGGMSQERFGTDVPLYHKLHYNPRGQLYDIRLSTASLAANEWDWNRGAIVNYYSGNYAWEGDPSATPSADNNGNLRGQGVFVPNGEGAGYAVGATTFMQTYQYDALNRLTSASESGGGLWSQAYAYDRWGNRTISQAGTQNAPAVQFEGGELAATNRLLAPGDAGLPAGQRRMRYDAAGNLVYDAYTGAGVRRYDAENRMVSAQTNNTQGATYAYDADGQRVRRNDGGAEVWQVYGVGDELVAEYAKDALPTSPQKEYGYRGGELLVTVEASSGWGPAPTFTGPDPLKRGDTILLEHLTDLRTAVNQLRRHAGLTDYDFTADPTPERKVTTVKAEHIRQLRQALEGALTRLGRPTGGYVHPTLYENSSPVYAVDFQELRKQVRDAWRGDAGGTDIRWVVADQLGTPRMAVDKTGSLAGVTRHDYFPFGEETGAGVGGRTTTQGYSQIDSVRQKFTGYERDDETGLDYAQARYYASQQGRFTSVDTGPFNLADPQSWNRYIYVQDNPLKFVDPDGKELVIRGADADYLVSELAKASGYTLRRNKKSGVVTIVGTKRKEQGTSKSLAEKLKEVVKPTAVVGGQAVRFTVTINTVRDDEAPSVLNDSFPKKAIDVTDYDVAKKDAPEFATRLLGHVLEEYFQAATTYAGLPQDEQRAKSHDAALVFESKVLGDFTGQKEQKRTNTLVNEQTIRFSYTSVVYDVLLKSSTGPGINTVVGVTKKQQKVP